MPSKKILEKPKGLSTEQKQLNLKTEFDSTTKDLTAEIKHCLEQHKTAVVAIQDDRVNKLHKLVLKRTHIEREMVKTTSELHDAYLRSKQLLGVVLDGRIEDCEANLRQLRSISETQNHQAAQESQEL